MCSAKHALKVGALTLADGRGSCLHAQHRLLQRFVGVYVDGPTVERRALPQLRQKHFLRKGVVHARRQHLPSSA